MEIDSIPNTPVPSPKYDVVIIGGGLAGLTLALQLRQARSDISILILEKRAEKAPIATHKVGESMSELGSSYLRNVLGLKDYLTEHHLPKYGLRFFFSPEHRDDISRRLELGSTKSDIFPSHQIDRGIFENDLTTRLMELGVTILLGAKALSIEIDKKGHLIHYEKEGKSATLSCSWLVDSSGRAGLLQRKLKLQKEMPHDVNAVWFRLDAEIDIQNWSEKASWHENIAAGRRHYATNHLMGEGYWIWIIPLVSGQTSIGIVADPSFHPFDTLNSFEKAMAWMEKQEPQAALQFQQYREKLMDFKVMKHFAYDTQQFYAGDRWALTGEAAAFMDPFYSPGMDFIALGNTWTSSLIITDLNGEDILLRSLIYEKVQRELINAWMLLYKDMYGLLGKAPIMMMKIIWDWATYWSIPALLFMNEGYTNVSVLKNYASAAKGVGHRFAKLNEGIQAMFRIWAKHPVVALSDRQVDFFKLDFLLQFHSDLHLKFTPEELIQKIQENLLLLEQIAAEMFRMVSASVHGTPEDMPVNPYQASLEMGKVGLLKIAEQEGVVSVVASIKADLVKVTSHFFKLKKDAFIN